MDETTLRTLLDSALTDEPPIGPVADNALRAGIKIRRRRVLGAAVSVAVAAAIAIVIPVVAGPLGDPPASEQHPPSMTGLTRPPNVPPPDKSVLRWPALAKDRTSIVKIIGDATSCHRRLEGSGFVISPQHVLTNAHVVDGVTRPHVHYGTSKVLPAKVVLFDSNTDVAILYVPGLDTPPLRFAGKADWGSDAVVAGYPLAGKFRAVAARVGSQWSATTPNIYQTGRVTRAIYTVRARVEPGSSGGPLLASNGNVYGVIFAVSVNARDAGYALTASAVEPDVRHGARATTPVSTNGCD